MARTIKLHDISTEINDCVYTSLKYPLLVDPTGQAVQFLKYRGRHLSVFKKGDFDKETLRKSLTQALHNGAWLILDFDKLACDVESLFDKDHFPDAVLSPHELFLEETLNSLLRPTDGFAAKVTYEHQAALAEGAFQDRTKAHAPERVADVDSRFDPKDAFRLIVATKLEELPADLAERMVALKVECSAKEQEDNAGRWAGREKPRKEKSKEQQKLDTDLLELAFDGELEAVKELLGKGADPLTQDGRGHSPLSEAAVQGHLETVTYLLDWNAPIGSDPNSQGSDGRTALHRAAFQGHQAVVQLLLERGSDPRTKDRQGELPFDMASNDETRQALEAWDASRTDKLKEERAAAIDAEDEKNVRNEEERVQLMRKRKTAKLCELAEQGEKDLLEIELMDLEQKEIIGYRDDRGNNVLHIAVTHDKLDCVVMLLEEYSLDVNTRDAKGWTPIAISAFHGHKNLCKELIGRKGDPMIENAYRKDAFQVAKDDEIKETLTMSVDGGPQEVASSSTPAGSPEEDEEGDKAKAKGKAKAKAKGKAAAGGKAKAKAKK